MLQQLPLVEIDGLNLVQSKATANYLGARLGLLPTSPAEAYLVECVYGSSQDARMPMVGLPFAPYPDAPTAADYEKKLADMRGASGLLGRHVPKWEAMLRKRTVGGRSSDEERTSFDGPFVLGVRPSIADVGIFECADFYESLYGADAFKEAFKPYPRVRALVDATRALGRLAEHCELGRRGHETWDPQTGKHTNLLKYATAVRSTLA